MLPKQELFARLAQGHAAAITVVTPNARLARELGHEFDRFQAAAGLALWDAPDILAFDTFVERLWQDAAVAEHAQGLPPLLGMAQEQQLWEEILAASDLLAVPQAAAQCRDAWRKLHLWRVGNGPGNEDAAAFAAWSKEYQRRTRGLVDSARLPDVLPDHWQGVARPKLLVAYAFDIVPPQTRAFFERFALEECLPEPRKAKPVRAGYGSAKEEIEAAARWARARLEEGKGRIGVVVPALAQKRREVARIFARVMQPAWNLPGAERASLPFNVSLGLPLEEYPLVGAALDLLELSLGALEFERTSRLLRSPFLFGAEGERAKRAALDVRLRRELDATVSLPKLVAAVADRCPQLRACLEVTYETAKNAKARTPSEWARHFSALLEAAGFPGERVLDSDEYQTLAKWHQALAEVSRLERVSRAMSGREALGVLRRLCAERLFQPESLGAPVQVLGILESAGLRFDCLWVSGLTDEAWPLPARPNPFLPVALQKKAGIPEASAEGALELDRRLTTEWKRAADEVVLSAYSKDKDRDVAPSALILDVEKGEPAVPDYPRYRDLLFAGRQLESFADVKGPAFAGREVRGGTRVLADQAACPFRAFAKWRLAADELEETTDVPDARTRGSLLHAFMKFVWETTRASEALLKDPEPALAGAAEQAVREVGIEGRFAELERERLVRLGREWLQVEARREPFEVKAVEEKRPVVAAGLEFATRIDRIDALRGGGHALLDYKTGQSRIDAWLGERPDDPQLPLYVLNSKENVTAVSFAQLRTGDMKFKGYAEARHLLPNVEPPKKGWPALLREWKRSTEALGAEFAAGEARVEPKYGRDTCRLCHLRTLCRVQEKPELLEGGE